MSQPQQREDYAQKTQEDEKNVMETGKPIINKVEKIVDNQGLEHWISITKIPRYNKDNNIIGIIGINRDITEIKKSEEKYKHLFDKAIDPIITIDKKGKFVDVNEEVIKLLEYNKKDLIGKDFTKTNILTQRSIKKAQDNLLKKMKGENVPPYEVEVITKTGEIIPAEINASTISEYNQVKGYLIILRDLRERYKRKKIEKELNTSERKFRDIFEGTSDLLIYIEKGIILDINNAIVNLLNIKKQDVLGKKISILRNYFTEEDSEKHINAIDLASTGSDVTDYETELITNKGLRYEFLFSVDCICNDENIKGIIIQGKDITQRNHELKELVKLEEKYRILAETSADGVITIDPLGRLTYVNPSFGNEYISLDSQIEVYNLINTFSKYDKLIHTNNIVHLIPFSFPQLGSIEFKQLKHLSGLINELQNPTYFISVTQRISKLKLGTTICDLSIRFNNYLIIIKIIRT